VQRRKYVDLVETVKGRGGEVLIFSSMHESGQREWLATYRPSVFPLINPHAELNQLTGIAAILTYPLDVDVVEAEEQELKEEAERAAAEGS
jgi:protein pelota